MKLYKYGGKIYDGRWKVISRQNTNYILENIFNQNQIIISEKTLRRIDSGETTISKSISTKLFRAGKSRFGW